MNKIRFLHSVAKQVVQLNSLETVVVLPNRRAGLFLKREISKCIEKASFLPEIWTIEQYMYSLSGLIKVETSEQLFRLFTSYKQHFPNKEKQDNFDQFLNWGPTFLSDCNEIDTNLIDADAFFDELYYDRTIRNWNVADPQTELQNSYLEFWKYAKLYYSEFTSKLLSDGRAYNGLAYRYATDHLNQLLPNLPFKNHLFVGFNALNQAEKKLFETLHDNQMGTFYWDLDSYYEGDKENKAGQYFRKYKTQWPENKQLANPPKQIGQHTENISIFESPNDLAQCTIAAKWIENLKRSNQISGANTAIILADENLLEPLLYQLPKEELYNVTMGKSVAQFPLYHFFDEWLQLHESTIKVHGQKEFNAGNLQSFLQNFYVQAIDQNHSTQSMRQFIVANNISIVQETDWKRIIKSPFLVELLQQKHSIADFINSLQEIIERMRSYFQDQQDRLSIQVLFELKKIVQQLSTCFSHYSEQISIHAFRNLLRQVARNTTIPFEGEPLRGIQIMGVLETRCLDFDHIMILSTNEGILPKGKTDISFIPFVFKKQFNIQTFQDKDAIYAYSFYRLLHQAKTINFVYNGQESFTSTGEISRFVQQLEAEFEEKTNSKATWQKYTGNYLSAFSSSPRFILEKNEEIVTQIKQYLTQKALSPSSLKLLINAPLDFYFRYIARIKEPNNFSEDIELNTLGNIVHRSLELLYEPLLSQQLTHENLQQLLNQHKDAVQHAAKEIVKQGDLSHGINFLYIEAAKSMVKEAIKVDLDRITQYTIIPIGLEKDLACSLELTILQETIKINIAGKADRIQKRDDCIEIIDYKTGSVDEAQLKSSKINDISNNPKLEKLHQLLCYCLMEHLGNNNVPLAQLRPAMQALKSWNQGLSFINSNANYELSEQELTDYIGQIKLVLEQLLDPSLPFVPETDESRLTYSNYQEIYWN